MSSAEPHDGERIILQEDCAEDRLKNGILTLTNKRIVFEKTEGRMATFSKKVGDTVLDIPISKISSARAEGFIIKKVVIYLSDGTVYKFGVFNSGKWAKIIGDTIKNTSNI